MGVEEDTRTTSVWIVPSSAGGCVTTAQVVGARLPVASNLNPAGDEGHESLAELPPMSRMDRTG